MRHYCTISDYNYLRYGLALFNSLKKHSREFRLHYLCTDAESYERLRELNYPEIEPVYLDELLKVRTELAAARNLPASYEALNVANKTGNDAQRLQFFWCLTPFFTWHLLDSLEDIDNILYIDSDIYFFGDPEAAYKEVGYKSIGIVRHRIPYVPAVGEFNVGIVYFKQDLAGYRCLEWWKNCLLDPDNQHYKTHGICGDQKYLELFAPLFGEDNVKVLDDNIGHLAPWNIRFHGYENDKVVWLGREQDLMYIHFSNFKPDFEQGTYEMAPRHNLVEVPPFVKEKYDEYFREVRAAEELLS